MLVPDGGSPQGEQGHDVSKFVGTNDPTKISRVQVRRKSREGRIREECERKSELLRQPLPGGLGHFPFSFFGDTSPSAPIPNVEHSQPRE